MGEINSVERKSKTLHHGNQEITGKASTSLPCSSTASCLDQGSTQRTTSYQTRVSEECSDANWYYMFLHNSDLKKYIDIFTGKTHVHQLGEGKKYKLFPYTTVDHRNRFEKCKFNKNDYKVHKEAAEKIKKAFSSNDIDNFNNVTIKEAEVKAKGNEEEVKKIEIKGDGFLFVCAPLNELNVILDNMIPRRYLITKYKTGLPAPIPEKQMEEFIYLYEYMPYNLELLEHSIEEYTKTKTRIRMTGGAFEGKEGYLMRLHRNSHIVFSFGGLTVAISDIHAFPFEKAD